MNPQIPFGADVISRLQYALNGGENTLRSCIRRAMKALAEEVCLETDIPFAAVTKTAIVCNTPMHHLLLGCDPLFLR